MGEGFQKLMKMMGGPPDPKSKLGRKFAVNGVVESPEFIRIREMPRREIDEETTDLSPYFVHNPGKCDEESCLICVNTPVRILPKQNQMLNEAFEVNGLMTSAGVGSGKTLPSWLMYYALSCKRMVLIVKPRLREKMFNDDIPAYSRHFRLPPIYLAPRKMRFGKGGANLPDGVYVVAYSELSLAHREGLLEYIDPDCVVSDEAHLFRGGRRGSGRTKRYYRFLDPRPWVRVVNMSGSFLRRSIRDVAPLSELALKKDSPYPRGPTLFEFSRAVDPDVEKPLQPGKLMDLTTFYEDEEGQVRQETAREGLNRRISESRGFVATPEGSAPQVSLEIRARYPKLSDDVKRALDQLENYWAFDGTEYGDALSMTRVRRQLCCGFFYRWKWENGEPTEEDLDWLAARNAWNKQVREYLKHHSTPGRDTPLQLFNAAARGEWKVPDGIFETWCHLKDRPEPDTETIWIDKQPVIDDVRSWMAEIKKEGKTERGVIFWDHRALQQLFIEMGIPTFGAGKEDATRLDKELSVPRSQVITCSRLAHGTGVNMQRFNWMYLINPPAAGLEYQQNIGREVRQGQMADTVTVDIAQHTQSLQDAVRQAVSDARFQQELGGEKQLLLIGDKTGFHEDVFKPKVGRHGLIT